MKKLLFITIAVMVSIAAMADVWISPGQGRTYTLLQLSQIAASGVKRPLPKLAPQAFTLNDTIVISVNDTLEIENKDNFQLKDVSGSIFVDGAVKMSPKDSATIRCITTFSGESSKPGQMVFRKGASNAIIRNMRFERISVRWDSDSSLDIRNTVFTKIWNRNALQFVSRPPAQHIVYNNTFIDCHKVAISVNSTLTKKTECGIDVQGNTVLNCGDSVSNTMPVIDLMVGGALPVSVENNTVIGNKFDAGGIRVYNGLNTKGENNVLIKGNTVKGMAFGINVTGGQAARIIDNVCEDNHYARNTFLGYAIGIMNTISANGIGKTTWVEGNTMKGSQIGLYVSGKNTKANVGNVELSGSSSYNPGNNKFDQNGFEQVDGGYIYSLNSPCDLYNNTPNDMYAEGNTWGANATTDEEIRARIRDFYFKDMLGKVWFRIGQDGVESTEADVMIIAIYDLQGNRHKTVTSGINIVRYSDESIRKIMVR